MLREVLALENWHARASYLGEHKKSLQTDAAG